MAWLSQWRAEAKNFVLTDKEDIKKCLGIETTQLDDDRFNISQPIMIDIIVSYLNIDTNEYGMYTSNTLAA